MKTFQIIFLLSLFLYGIIALDVAEYNAFITLAQKANLDVSSATVSNLCTWDKTIVTCINENISMIKLNFTSQVTLEPTDFPFPKIGDLRLKTARLSDNFLNTLLTNSPEMRILFLNDLGLKNVTINSRRLISLNIDNNPLSNIQNLSSLYDPNFFSAYNTQNEDVEWVNDLTSDLHYLSEVAVKTSKYPDFSTLNELNTINIQPSTKFTGTTFKLPKNLAYALGFRDGPNTPLKFPTLVGCEGCVFSLYVHNMSFYVTEPLDLSQFAYDLISIDDSNFGLLNGAFPFKKLDTSNLKYLQVSSMKSFKEINFDVVKKVPRSMWYYNNIESTIPQVTLYDGDLIALPQHENNYRFDISYNKFHGSVPDWFCNIKATFKYNELTGNVPTCYTCHLNVSSTWDYLIGNNFDNVPTAGNTFPECTTMKISKVFLSSNTESGQLYNFNIQGTDLGWVNATVHIFQVSFNVSAYKYNEWFYAPILAGLYDDAIKAGSSALVSFQNGRNITIDISSITNNIVPPSTAFPPEPKDSSESSESSSETSSTTTTGTPGTTGTPNPSSTTGSPNPTSTTTGEQETIEPSSATQIKFSSVLFLLSLLSYLLI